MAFNQSQEREYSALKAWLIMLFREANERFFEGKLPEYTIEICNLDKPRGQVWLDAATGKGFRCAIDSPIGWCICEVRVILLDVDGLPDARIREILLHEMCHAASPNYRTSNDSHGKRFVAAFRRIAAAGEKWAKREAEYYSRVPRPKRGNLPKDVWEDGWFETHPEDFDDYER